MGSHVYVILFFVVVFSSHVVLCSHIAFQCANTFRASDHFGGCNGGRIRIAPQKDWIFNNGVQTVIDNILSKVQAKFPNLSYADLIVLSGTVALQAENATLSFCGGRGDATTSYPFLMPGFNYSNSKVSPDWLSWQARMSGLTLEEYVALHARPRSANQMARMGYTNGTWSEETSSLMLTNLYFQRLLNEQWTAISDAEYANADKTAFMTVSDMKILWDPVARDIALNFASDAHLFVQTFSSAWVKLMNADRFDAKC